KATTTICLAGLFLIAFLSKPAYAQIRYSNKPSDQVLTLLPDNPGSIPIILTWDYNVFVMGPEEISRFVSLAKEKNIQQINLRINNKGVMNARIENGTVYSERLDAFGKTFDPLQVLVEEGHRQGLKVAVHF